MPETETTNSVHQALSDLQADILDLRRKQAGVGEQVNRIQRTVRLDEREFNVGKLQSERAILDTVSQLARAVDALVKGGSHLDREERAQEESANLYQSHKNVRKAEVRANIAHDRYLSTLGQESTYLCPCGEHTGLRFVTHTGQVVEENLCPKSWWIKQSRLAFEDRVLGAFVKKFPLSEYLESFKLGG